MKLIKDDNITIFLSNSYIKNIDIENRESIEKLIHQINKKYNIELYGYYYVQIYIDKNYGIIINIKKEELEYMDYFNNALEMNIEIIEDSFLYKVEDIFSIKDMLNKLTIRKYDDNFYIEVKRTSDIDLGIILENAEIIYGQLAQNIKRRSKIIKSEVILWKDQLSH